jgi:hypothetical protein
MSNLNKNANSFFAWLGNHEADRLEKVISLSILTIEIILLFIHNISANVSFYMFTTLNCVFAFFTYLTLMRKKWNPLFTFDRKFVLEKNYNRSFITKLDNLFMTEEDREKQNKLDSAIAMENIEQFRIIRWAWFFTGLLYLVLIFEKYVTEDETFKSFVNEFNVKTFVSFAINFLSLLSAYYYLVVYNVMHNNTISDKNGKFKPTHIKSTLWFIGTSVIIIVVYIISYNHFISNQEYNTPKILFSEKSQTRDTLYLLGEKQTYENKNSNVILVDNEENATHEIIKENSSTNDTLVILSLSSHKEKTVIKDFYHKVFVVKRLCEIKSDNVNKDECRIKLIVMNQKDSRLVKLDKSIDNVDVVFGSINEGISSVDFFFKCIIGIVTGLIMCFVVGRFESLTFKTPTIVLLVLYLYSLIQCFLPIIDTSFFVQNENLQAVHQSVTKTIFFLALLGKVVLYVYIVGLYQTKRLFYYFIETQHEISGITSHWRESMQEIKDENMEWEESNRETIEKILEEMKKKENDNNEAQTKIVIVSEKDYVTIRQKNGKLYTYSFGSTLNKLDKNIHTDEFKILFNSYSEEDKLTRFKTISDNYQKSNIPIEINDINQKNTENSILNAQLEINTESDQLKEESLKEQNEIKGSDGKQIDFERDFKLKNLTILNREMKRYNKQVNKKQRIPKS